MCQESRIGATLKRRWCVTKLSGSRRYVHNFIVGDVLLCITRCRTPLHPSRIIANLPTLNAGMPTLNIQPPAIGEFKQPGEKQFVQIRPPELIQSEGGFAPTYLMSRETKADRRRA